MTKPKSFEEKAEEAYVNFYTNTPAISPGFSFISGAKWARTKTIVEILSLLRSGEADKYQNQEMVVINPMQWADWLEAKLLPKSNELMTTGTNDK